MMLRLFVKQKYSRTHFSSWILQLGLRWVWPVWATSAWRSLRLSVSLSDFIQNLWEFPVSLLRSWSFTQLGRFTFLFFICFFLFYRCLTQAWSAAAAFTAWFSTFNNDLSTLFVSILYGWLFTWLWLVRIRFGLVGHSERLVTSRFGNTAALSLFLW